MTNAELIAKIRAEIERRYNKHKYSTAITEMVYAEEDEQILSFLDTLQEQDVKPDELEKAAIEYCPDDAYPFGPMAINLEVRKAFIAGYNLCKEQMLKEAKDGYVSAIIIHNDGDEEHYAVTYPNGERPHSITDKVKIIIL